MSYLPALMLSVIAGSFAIWLLVIKGSYEKIENQRKQTIGRKDGWIEEIFRAEPYVVKLPQYNSP